VCNVILHKLTNSKNFGDKNKHVIDTPYSPPLCSHVLSGKIKF